MSLDNSLEFNFSEVINMIETRRNNAYKKVNEELISLYWDFGKYISEKVNDSNWGDKIVDKLVEFMKREYPTMRGFNRAGIYRMKQFYETYKDNEIVAPMVRQISWTHNVVILGVTNSIEEKFKVYRRKVIMNLRENTEFIEDEREDIENDIIPVVKEVTGDSNIQANKVEGTTQITIKTRTLSKEERDDLNNKLADSFDVDESTITFQSISSTISGEMRADAVKAVIISTICMLIYIWFRFKDIRFGASAIIALIHDVLVVLTVYALMRISVGNTFIACMLTIIGYSVNDTIVIFDRIRENLALKHGKQTREDLMEVANRSLTQTLSRSINTSITTFIMVFMLFLLGVASIREFALPLMAGMICGAYSSICIATELWYVMKVHLGKNKITE